jgi:predicted nucleic acid-binding protein
MSDELKPDNLDKGTAEYALVHYAYEVARAIQRVKQAARSGDAGEVKNGIVWLKFCLTRIRSVTRGITEEMKEIEHKQVLRPTDIEPGS